MDPLVLVLRSIHILFGAFWAGAIIVVAFFLGPAIADAGPDGAKVMGALVKRKLLNVVPAAAVLSIVSGLWLYWHDSSGMQGPWIHSMMARTLGVGAVLALVGFAVGVTVMRPSTMKAMALGASMAQLPEADRAATMTQIQQLRGRAAKAGRLVAVLLIGAVLTMAVGRYL